jgi:DNA-binding NtrC family response regulator
MEKASGVSTINLVPALADDEVLTRKPPAIESGGGVISVLSVNPLPDDSDALDRILHPPQWRVYKADTLKSALAVLERNRLRLVVCESNLGRETWREALAQITLTPEPPLLIVASRLADADLWAEALNLGAYDVLAKPFDRAELTRTLTSAWLHWRDRQDVTRRPALWRAAGGF